MEVGTPGCLSDGLTKRLHRFGVLAFLIKDGAEQLHRIDLAGNLVKDPMTEFLSFQQISAIVVGECKVKSLANGRFGQRAARKDFLAVPVAFPAQWIVFAFSVVGLQQRKPPI
jgi:hypothetical protein